MKLLPLLSIFKETDLNELFFPFSEYSPDPK